MYKSSDRKFPEARDLNWALGRYGVEWLKQSNAKDGEVIGNKLKIKKFNKNLIDGEKTYSAYWNDQKSISLLELILKWRNFLTEKPGTKYLLDKYYNDY